MGGIRTPAIATALALLVPAAPAAAITKGEPDDGRHPYVGALVTHNGKHRKKRLICTGTLVSPTVFLTAAHCLLDEPTALYVSFDAFVGAPDVGPEVTLHPGSAVGHPEYVDSAAPGDTHDIGVVRLDPPVEGVVPAQLPAPDALDDLERSHRLSALELVGYGREGMTEKGTFYGGGGRRFGVGAFGSLEPYKLNTDQTGTYAGSCNGDSGGPILLPGTRTVVGIISDGDPECAVNGINYRVDTASARSFLGEFVPLPPRGTPPAPATAPQDPAAEPATEPATEPAATATVVEGPGFEPVPTALVTARFQRSRRGARLRSLRVTRLARGAGLELRCSGRNRAARRSCPFRVRAFGTRTDIDLTKAFGRRRMRSGTVITLRVYVPGGAKAQTTRWTIGRTRVARRTAG